MVTLNQKVEKLKYKTIEIPKLTGEFPGISPKPLGTLPLSG